MAAPSARYGGRRQAVVLGLGALVVLAVRLWYGRVAEGIGIVADEPGYLAAARWLAGVGEPWNLAHATGYAPGYGFLLAPLEWLGSSPAELYRHVIWTNVGLGVASYLLLFGLVRRLSNLDGAVAVAVAAAVALLPASSLETTWALSENLLLPLFLGLVLVSLRLMDRPRPGAVVALAALTAALALTHGRMVPVVAVTVAIFSVLGLRRRLERRWAVLGVVLTVAGYVMVRLVTMAVWRSIYPPGEPVDSEREVLDRIVHVPTIVVEAAGQTWYLLVTTAMLAGLGVFILLRTLAGGRDAPRPRRAGPPFGRLHAAAILAFVTAEFLLSVVYMVDRNRADHLVYGRYNDVFTPVLVVIGIGALFATPRRVLVRAGVVLTGLLVVVTALLASLRAGELAGFGLPIGALGLVPFGYRGDEVPLWWASSVALVAGGALLLAGLRRRVAAIVALVVVLVTVSTARTAPFLDRRADEVSFDLSGAARIVHPDDVILFRRSEGPLLAFYLAQFALPNQRFEEQSRAWPLGSTRLVLSAQRDAELERAGWRLVLSEPKTAAGLWVAPSRR